MTSVRMLLAGLLGVLAVGLLGLPLTHGKNLYTQELHDDTDIEVPMEERMDAISDIDNNPSAFVEAGVVGRHPTSSSPSDIKQLERGKGSHKAAIAVHQAAIVTHQEALNAMEAAERKMNALTDQPTSRGKCAYGCDGWDYECRPSRDGDSCGVGCKCWKKSCVEEADYEENACKEEEQLCLKNSDKCKKAKNGAKCGTGCACWDKNINRYTPNTRRLTARGSMTEAVRARLAAGPGR
ncbi:unnamed protein product [Vitrella brassicaformis CCMP3155]|uniref:Uncharacterized protein n=1 Tax=Vitrella brassicaformis (strain CCMP3155) TaxID=1169540 RepID=A0A0G4EJ08_VITBC|nr:unnamed protein product [Vitrella brassicaformis CCMP3155]|eukprot:CEL95979.1 unnamed protein product [Vitrella brassicaformis CCMP3155]